MVQLRDGTVRRHPVTLSRRGRGVVSVGFAAGRVRRVLVTVANASTRYRCRQGTTFSCRGVARDDHRGFAITAKAYRR